MSYDVEIPVEVYDVPCTIKANLSYTWGNRDEPGGFVIEDFVCICDYTDRAVLLAPDMQGRFEDLAIDTYSDPSQYDY
jgi:hypothetical protein